MKLNFILISLIGLFLVGCNQTTQPTVDQPETQVKNEINVESTLDESDPSSLNSSEISRENQVEENDTTDLFGTETEMEISL